MKNFLALYQSYSREYRLEEPMDFFFYRPMAFLIVRATFRLPLTPNHFSLLGLASALYAAFNLSQGQFALGGMGILIFGIFDCCDGMLARVKKNGSPNGEQIDMFVDVIANISFFSGLLIGLVNHEIYHDQALWLLLSVVSILLHSTLYNFYKKQYFYSLAGSVDGQVREMEQFKRQLLDLKKQKRQPFRRLLLSMAIKFSQLQNLGGPQTGKCTEGYAYFQKQALPFWGIIAGSSHLTVLALCLIFDSLTLYFYFSLFFANLWMLLAYAIQKGMDRSALGAY